jgi:hypothetical protein
MMEKILRGAGNLGFSRKKWTALWKCLVGKRRYNK